MTLHNICVIIMLSKKKKDEKMNTRLAITITQETLEETLLKMLKSNLKEFQEDKYKATDKYIKKALELKNKARIFLEENKEDFIRAIEFSLKGDE